MSTTLCVSVAVLLMCVAPTISARNDECAPNELPMELIEHDGRGMEQLKNDAAPKAVTVQVTGHDNVPKHGPAEAIGCGSPEADESLSTPQAHYRITAG